MVELATILVGVVVPLIIGPLSVFCKSLWDRYSKSKELKVKNRYEKKMSELSDKINLFYWPVYLKLKTLDRINYHIASQTNNNPESDSKCCAIINPQFNGPVFFSCSCSANTKRICNRSSFL